MAFDYSKLLGKIREEGMTQADVATAIGLNPATLNAKLKGKSSFTSDEIMDLCKRFEIPTTEISAYFFTT